MVDVLSCVALFECSESVLPLRVLSAAHCSQQQQRALRPRLWRFERSDGAAGGYSVEFCLVDNSRPTSLREQHSRTGTGRLLLRTQRGFNLRCSYPRLLTPSPSCDAAGGATTAAPSVARRVPNRRGWSGHNRARTFDLLAAAACRRTHHRATHCAFRLLALAPSFVLSFPPCSSSRRSSTRRVGRSAAEGAVEGAAVADAAAPPPARIRRSRIRATMARQQTPLCSPHTPSSTCKRPTSPSTMGAAQAEWTAEGDEAVVGAEAAFPPRAASRVEAALLVGVEAAYRAAAR